MKQRTGDRLLLDQQTGTDLHLAADAKRVDTLIANGLARARTNDLPVIIFRALIDCLLWLAFVRQSEQIEPPVVVYDLRRRIQACGYD